MDLLNTPNLTWTVTKPVAGGAEIDGFTAATRVSGMVQGGHTAQVTRQLPTIKGVAAARQAIETPSSRRGASC